MPGARELARAQILTDITTVARRHLESDGAAALSLRAVARELGMVSSAVYRYVESRDALLTMLVIEAYDSLGEAAEAAERESRHRNIRHRWRAVTRAIRDWALAHRAEYGLVFGTPVPGYAAPETTVGPATRVPFVLMRLLDEAGAAGLTARPVASAAVRRDLEGLRELVPIEADPGLLAQGVVAWTGVFGTISFELFGHYVDSVSPHPLEWFDEAMSRLLPGL